MHVATNFASATPKARPSPSWKETIVELRRTVVGRGFYDLCLEPRAIREAGADGFDVSIALLRVATDNGGGRKEGNFPEVFRRAGATIGQKASAVYVLCEIKFGEGLSRQDAERKLSELAAKLRQGGGYADSLIEEMGYKDKIEQTKPAPSAYR